MGKGDRTGDLDGAGETAYAPRMTFNDLSPTYSVSPFVQPDAAAAIAAAGFTTVISNLPDREAPPGMRAADMAAACTAAGLRFVHNPVSGGELTFEIMETQKEEGLNAEGRTLAFCASGGRSAVLWAILQAGHMPVDDILNAAAQAGYPLGGLRPQLEAMARD